MSISPQAIRFYRPGKGFPTFSVTGSRCSLCCDHCAGRYLKGMNAVASPDELLVEAEKLKRRGGKGFLLSGGCDEDGKGVACLSPWIGPAMGSAPPATRIHHWALIHAFPPWPWTI